MNQRKSLESFFGYVARDSGKENIWDDVRERDKNINVRELLHDDEHTIDTFDNDNQSLDSNDEDTNYDSENDSEFTSDDSVMGMYLKSIQTQLQMECNTKTASGSVGHPFSLLDFLKDYKFWIRGECAKYICRQLKLNMDSPGYYLDVLVWLPDQ